MCASLLNSNCNVVLKGVFSSFFSDVVILIVSFIFFSHQLLTLSLVLYVSFYLTKISSLTVPGPQHGVFMLQTVTDTVDECYIYHFNCYS